MKKLFFIAIVILGFATVSFGQLSATATATGTVVTAQSITSGGANLSFGRFTVGASAGTIAVGGVGSPSPVVSGGVTSVGGPITSANFIITGNDANTYTVTLPSNGSVSVTSGANSMTVTNFSCDVAAAGTSVVGTSAVGTLSGTSRTFYVGATLNAAANQPTGIYSSSTFPVTIAFN